MDQSELRTLLQDAETTYNQAKEDYLASKRDRNALGPLPDNATAAEKGARTKQISKLATEAAKKAHLMSMSGEEVVNLRRMMSMLTSVERVTQPAATGVQGNTERANETSGQSSNFGSSKMKIPELPGFRDITKRWNVTEARVFIAKFESILEANEIPGDRWVKALITCLTYEDAEYARSEWKEMEWEEVRAKFVHDFSPRKQRENDLKDILYSFRSFSLCFLIIKDEDS